MDAPPNHARLPRLRPRHAVPANLRTPPSPPTPERDPSPATLPRSSILGYQTASSAPPAIPASVAPHGIEDGIDSVPRGSGPTPVSEREPDPQFGIAPPSSESARVAVPDRPVLLALRVVGSVLVLFVLYVLLGTAAA